jgi:hypothetical protein
LKVARLATSVSMVCAIVVIAAVALGWAVVAIVTAIVSGGASIVALRALTPRKPVRRTRAPSASEGSVLVATLKNAGNGAERITGDLQRVLAGIVADERGAIDRAETETLVASFSRNDHAGAAVHAAQRMLSNVDAVSRRLGHDLRITIAVHCGPRTDETVGMATKVRDATTDSVPVLVSEPAARRLAGQLERVDTIGGDGWTMDVFTFPPAQKRLPGF